LREEVQIVRLREEVQIVRLREEAEPHAMSSTGTDFE